MNLIDALLLGVIAASSAWGCWRGAWRSVFGLFAFAAAFVAAKQYAPHAFLLMTGGKADSSPLLLAAAYMGVFFAVLAPLMVLSNWLQTVIKKLDLGALDKFAGLLFGVLRGLLLAFIAVVMLTFVPLGGKDESALLPVFGGVMQSALNHPSLKQYGKYWVFNDKGAPSFNASALAADAIEKNIPPGDDDNSPEKENLPQDENSGGNIGNIGDILPNAGEVIPNAENLLPKEAKDALDLLSGDNNNAGGN